MATFVIKTLNRGTIYIRKFLVKACVLQTFFGRRHVRQPAETTPSDALGRFPRQVRTRRNRTNRPWLQGCKLRESPGCVAGRMDCVHNTALILWHADLLDYAGSSTGATYRLVGL